MSRLSQFALATGLILGLLAVAGIYLSTSAWFLWGLFPEEGRQVLADTGGKTGPLLTAVAERYHLGNYLPLNPTHVFRFVYSVSDSHRRLVIVPTLGHWTEIRSTLTASGWQVKGFGLLLVAEQGLITVPNSWASWGKASWQGVKQFSRAVMWQRLPSHPVLLGVVTDSQSIPGLPIPSRLIATRHDAFLQFRWQAGGAWPKGKVTMHLPESGQGFLAIVPGHTLMLLPKGLSDAWNTWLAEKMHFSHTKPDILAALANLENVIIANAGEAIAIGTHTDSDQFLAQAETWLRQEVAASQPLTRAFRLPDGTLGYEKQPGHPLAAFGPAGADGCRLSQGAPVEFRLCHLQKGAFLTTASGYPNIAQMIPLLGKNSWYVEIGPALASLLPGSRNLQASGDTTSAILELHLVE